VVRQVWLGSRASFYSLHVLRIGRHYIITTIWSKHHVHDVAYGDGVGSRNTQLFAQSRYFKQTQFLSVKLIMK